MKKVLLYAGMIFLSACEYQVADKIQPVTDPPACNTELVTFATIIQPMLSQSCGSCHSGGGASGGVRLDNYNSIKQVAQSGKLIGVISHTKGFSAMPQGGAKLSDCKIQQVQAWINKGLPNN
ncbi:cytochrome c [Rhodocytophaga rosea]|uniref:Cytochrome c n=1 Tax=Rhodocytophaga rosea TaxID=2704465 RepID=A0A6C0GKG1_9BACT|nr:cytochrome c [Rhodocytophaga rosea]QHT68485.1 cytochrome c [Rhodocytophaga rosea]